MKHNKQLISHDEQNSDYFYKYTNFCELAPICRDDLVILPPKVQKQLGGIGPLILVYKMTTCVHVVDIKTMRTHEIASPKYWETMFTPICSRERLTPFIVLNIEDIDFDVETSRAAARNKFRMVQVELAKESEFGSTNQTYIVHTHLGEFLNFNDTVLCYDLE
jgi:nonsense-mediated mRNA decay protein 3